MIVLVCGGRDYHVEPAVFRVLDALHGLGDECYITRIVHGGATGADALADKWAKSRRVAVQSFPISREQWRWQGRSAGPARNARMLALGKPDVVVAFPGGDGTSDMLRRSRAERIRSLTCELEVLFFVQELRGANGVRAGDRKAES